MKKIAILKSWEKATKELTDFFVNLYFRGTKKSDWYWIGGEVGETIEVSNYFFHLDDMVNFIRYNYSKEDLVAYVKEVEENNFKRKSNIKNWKKLKYYANNSKK